MCGRVRLSSDYSEIKIRLKFAPNAPAPNFEPDWNKAPTEPMLVAIRSVDGERVPKMMRWGLVPHWAKDDRQNSNWADTTRFCGTIRRLRVDERV
jgi:putative SOS response-associated peptidase YedK